MNSKDVSIVVPSPDYDTFHKTCGSVCAFSVAAVIHHRPVCAALKLNGGIMGAHSPVEQL